MIKTRVWTAQQPTYMLATTHTTTTVVLTQHYWDSLLHSLCSVWGRGSESMNENSHRLKLKLHSLGPVTIRSFRSRSSCITRPWRSKTHRAQIIATFIAIQKAFCFDIWKISLLGIRKCKSIKSKWLCNRYSIICLCCFISSITTP